MMSKSSLVGNIPASLSQLFKRMVTCKHQKPRTNSIAEEFINTFLGNYEIGICEVTDMNILSVRKIFTYDEWVEKYKPVKNEFEYTSFEGCSFDYSEDDQWEFVKNQNPQNVWTMVWAEDTYAIIPGFHWVNRESYFVTEIPVQKEDLQTEFLVIE